MVKVLAFAITEGRVAIHCHAGLGRTGVLIACYLVYSLRVSANDAIRYVRLKRPGSVQTRGQIFCVRHFAQFVLPRTITYCLKENINKDKYMSEFNLSRFLRRQKVILHGYDERNFKCLPKIIHCICERMLKLCGCWIEEFPPSNIPFTFDFLYTKLNGNIQRYESSYSLSSTNDSLYSSSDLKSPEENSTPTSPNPSENGDPSDSFSDLSTLDGDEMNEELLIENRCFQELETQKCYNQDLTEESIVVQDINAIIDALLIDYSTLTIDVKRKVRQYQLEINTSQLGWAKLALETDLVVLAMLLLEWIEGLKQPVLRRDVFENIVIHYKQPELCFQKFPADEGFLVEYLLRFISKINPINKDTQDDLIKRIIAACAHQTLLIRGKMNPVDKGFKKLRDGTLACTLEFFQSLFEMIEVHHSLKADDYLEDNKMYNDANLKNDFQ